MSDKNHHKKDKDKDSISTEGSKKDGKKRKLKLGKRFRSSFSCVRGEKSPGRDMTEAEAAAATRGGQHSGTHFGHETHPLMDRRKSGAGLYGTGHHHREDDEKMLNDILGESADVAIEITKEEEEAYFPDEKGKTIVSLIILGLCFLLNTISLVLTHERMQKRDPLPDIFLDSVPTVDDGLYVGEIFIMIAVLFTFALMLLHHHRWIVFRRCFSILAIMYLVRSVTMYVTVLPVASYTYHCDPKMGSNATIIEGTVRVLKLVSGFGMSIYGRHTFCGDYMFSGHTVILVMSFLIIQEYAPRGSWQWTVLRWTFWLLCLAGIFLLMIARGHYTIDVIIAYYLTTITFWIYHTLANRADLKNNSATNFLSRVWWFRYFMWLEGNVQGVVPRHYSIPFTSDFIDFEKSEDTDNDSNY